MRVALSMIPVVLNPPVGAGAQSRFGNSLNLHCGFTVLVCAVCWAAAGWAQNVSTADGSSLGLLWPRDPSNEMRQSLLPGAGFSFTYDGKPVAPVDWAGWDWQQQGSTSTLRHSSGLTVVRTARAFAEFDAVEYTVVFRNDGQVDLPPLTSVKAIDLNFNRPTGAVDVLTRCGGGEADRQFPPGPDFDFTLTHTALEGQTRSISLGADRGRSSRLALPLFYLQNQAQDAGLFVGLGWSGQWRATVSVDSASHRLRIEGGIADLSLRLKPGEQIPGPTILLGCWRGALDVGVNRLRRLIRDRYSPSLDGQRLVPPVMYTTWFQVGAELDEKLAWELIDRAAEMGQEIFEIDASWYNGTPTAPYERMDITWKAISESLGNWDEGADAKRFPSGLKSLADRVRARGMQFGLWFEPERAGPESRLAREHPDWVMTIPGRRWVAVNLGNTAVQEYFCKLLDRYIDELGIRYIRWDMNNHDLLPYWQTKDSSGRQGITQIRYVEGLHRIEEHVAAKHPGVILENCAGGGLRIDLTSLARRHTIWISDAINTQVVRYHLEGLNQFIPGSGQVVSLSIPAAEARKPEFVLADYNCQVCFGGAFGLSGRLHEWSPATRQTVRRNVDAYKRLRRFLAEDFYPLVPQPRTDQTWAGWQFHNPKAQEGFIQAFRVRSPDQRRAFVPKALDPTRTYRFRDPYTDNRIEVSGAKLLSEGLTFDLPEMSSRVLLYTAAPQ
ncbi:MAG: alpha-galactosidase [Verrucomicrobiales bacterium]|nr:alpha-galactosidase [Verrucomicrobiales bacterium]